MIVDWKTMTREELIAIYEPIIRNHDILAFAVAWHDGIVGAHNAKNWRDFYRTWMRVKDYPLMWDIHYKQPVTKQHKISVCTVAGNRLKDIQQTLPLNIKDSEGYPAEFNLIDYGSTDGLEEWVKGNMMHHIESGLLNYYKVLGVKHFDLTHSRNIGFKLGTGDILTNFDADNIITDGLLSHINYIANQIPEKMVIVRAGRTYGNISFYRDDFFLLNGYNEDLKGRGAVAYHLQLRALEMGFTLGYYKEHREFAKNDYPISINMDKKFKNYKIAYDQNMFKIYANIMLGKLIANEGKEWGKATVIKNFKEEINT